MLLICSPVGSHTHGATQANQHRSSRGCQVIFIRPLGFRYRRRVLKKVRLHAQHAGDSLLANRDITDNPRDHILNSFLNTPFTTPLEVLFYPCFVPQKTISNDTLGSTYLKKIKRG